jgi:polysaccharide export outer membrane protein
VLLGLALVAAGCSHRAVKEDDQVQQMSEFRMSREDVIEVSVWKEPELSRTVPVRPDGKITLPLVGEMQAEGLKPQELEQSVAKALASYVRDPRVTVIVHDIQVLHADGRRVAVAYDDLVAGTSRVALGPGDTVVVP